MTLYLYKAINENGKQISGKIDADSKQAAMEMLVYKGYIPESVKEKKVKSTGGGIFSSLLKFTNSVPTSELIIFTKQFKTLIQAGVSILRIFQILEVQTENKLLKNATSQMTEEIKQGSSLFKAFSAHKNIFTHLYLSMLKAGEESGALPRVLDRLIYIIEHEEKIKNDVKLAVRYPIIVLCFLGVAFMVLLTFVVPKFVTIFENAGIELPIPTKICMLLYMVLSEYWIYLITILITVIFVTVRYIKTNQGRLHKDMLLMRIPILGPLFIKSAMSRFSSIFSILQSSGISIIESMQILTDAINNAAVSKEFERIKDLLKEGRGISQPLGKAKYFTPMVVNMVAIGEESGNLDEMLNAIAVHYDAEVEFATKGLADAIGPILMVGLAVVVGFFAFAIFLPMWDLTKMV